MATPERCSPAPTPPRQLPLRRPPSGPSSGLVDWLGFGIQGFGDYLLFMWLDAKQFLVFKK